MPIAMSPIGDFGAIVDIDVKGDLSGEERQAILDAYREKHLLVFRGQDLSREGQMDFLRMFGDVIENDPAGFISNVRKDFVGDNELVWHSDLIFTPEPHHGLSLYAVVVDPGVSATRFVNSEAALARLPEDFRRRLSGLRAVNISGGSGGSARDRDFDLPPDWPRHERPVISINPQTGREFLAVTLSQTSHIVGVDAAESHDILDRITEELYRPEHMVEHHWSTGDLIVWDNFALQHSRDGLAGQGRRDLERVIFGGRTIHEQYPEWTSRLRATLGTEDASDAAMS